MKNLITLCLMLVTFTALSQTPKFITIKRWKGGVLVSSKSYPLVTKYEVTQVKYVPVKQKVKPKVVEVKVPVPVDKYVLVVDYQRIDSLKAIINNMSNEYAKVSTQKGTYTLEKNQGTVVVEEKVSNNQVIGRTFSADVKPQVREKIVEVYRPKQTEWFMGPTVTTNIKTPFQSFGLVVQRKGKDENILQLSFGGTIRDGYMEPRAIFGLGWLLKLK